MDLGGDSVKIVTNVLLAPSLSREVTADGRADLRASMDSLMDHGASVILTAIRAGDAELVDAWYREEIGKSAPARAMLRFVTPGAFRWPGGVLRLPTATALPSDAVGRARSIILKNLPADRSDVSVDTGPDSDFLCLSSDTPLDDDWIGRIWDLCNVEETLLASDPGALEAVEAEGRLYTVLAPEPPSAPWMNIVRAEGIDPRRLLVLAQAGETDGPALLAFTRKLRELAGGLPTEVDPSIVLSVDPAEPGKALRDVATFVIAPRISAPSTVHFVERWSALNQKYVRENLWRATKAARLNENTAADLLSKINPSRFARAAELPGLAARGGGGRLLDDYCGGVCFDPGYYEFELPGRQLNGASRFLRNALIEYFDAKLEEMPFDRPLLRRRLFTNSLVLLRGEAYYTNLKQLSPWARARAYSEEAEALKELFRVLKRGSSFDESLRFAIGDKSDAARDLWKLLLGACDQARNLGLAMLSVVAHRWGDTAMPDYDKNLVEQAVGLVEAYYAVLLGDLAKCTPDLFERLMHAAVVCADELRDFATQEEGRARSADWYDPGAPIRGWREADNPYENLLTSLLAVTHSSTHLATAALGMFWGGVELPIVAGVAADAAGTALKATGFIRYGRYSSSASREEGYFCDLSTGGWRPLTDLVHAGSTRVIILDDNALSGRTLETARDMLIQAGVTDVQTWVVRFSGERREGQMRMNGGGIVQPAYLAERLRGFLHETPYARSYSRKHYQSPVGVFDTARSRVLRYLHNNGFASMFDREGF